MIRMVKLYLPSVLIRNVFPNRPAPKLSSSHQDLAGIQKTSRFKTWEETMKVIWIQTKIRKALTLIRSYLISQWSSSKQIFNT